ncbi:MarR family winged helix-turn-helix transcriptional regulator [Caproiciproducens sp. LBM24188]|nr:MarR family transcriptional regulator [Clostridiales bacterium]
MDEKRYLIKYCGKIMRKTQTYLDIVLRKYQLSSGGYSYLFELEKQEGISLEQISRTLGVDKAMSTRTVQKLAELGFITKIPDQEDSRAFRLYLTEKAHACLPAVREEISNWIEQITDGLSENEKDMAVELLKKIAGNAERKGMNQK